MSHPCRIRKGVASLLGLAMIFCAAACTWDNRAGGDEMGNFLQARLLTQDGAPVKGAVRVSSNRDTSTVLADAEGTIRIPVARRDWIRCEATSGQFLWDAPEDSGNAGTWMVGRPLPLRGWYAQAGTVSIRGLGVARRDQGVFSFDLVPPGRIRLQVATDSGLATAQLPTTSASLRDDAPRDSIILPALVAKGANLQRAAIHDTLACNSNCLSIYSAKNSNLLESLLPPIEPYALQQTSVCRPWVDNSATDWNPSIQYGTFCDERDSQTYRTVTIGSQTWMAQNLNYGNLEAIGSCYDGSQANCAVYGRIYTWSEAMGLDSSWNSIAWDGGDIDKRGICPEGAHVPSVAEWTDLIATVGARSGVGAEDNALKSATGWDPNGAASGNGTDGFGFHALPSGSRNESGYNSIGGQSAWLSATESGNPSLAIEYFIFVGSSGLVHGDNPKARGYSLRCVLD